MNGKRYTDYLERFHLRNMPTLSDLHDFVLKNNFACKLDLSEAYWSIRVQEADTSFLGIRFDGVDYVWLVAPMGLGTSAFACQEVTATVAEEVAADILVYYDDFLVGGLSSAGAYTKLTRLIQKLRDDKLLVNRSKSLVVPTRQIDYLQYRLDLERHQIFVGTGLSQRIRDLCSDLFSVPADDRIDALEHFGSTWHAGVPSRS
ncbi:hypothetical protein AKO1_014986, partial [Acrasis kona]